jgi:hypothetical protein
MKGGEYSEDLGADGKIILETVFGKNIVGGCEMDLSCSRQGLGAGCRGNGNEPAGSIKGRKFLD